MSVHKAFRVHQDLQVHKACKASKELPALPVRRDFKVHKASRVL